MNSILIDDKMCKSRRLTQELRQQCISKWYNTNTGVNAGAILLKQSIVSKSALEYATRLTESQFKATVQIRSGCVNLRTRPHQRRQHDNNINCRLCHHSIESIGHVLGECTQLHSLIISRHDAVVDLLHKHLSSIPNTTTIKEQLFYVNDKRLKPDIVHINNHHGRIAIIDPTIRVERDAATREQQIMEKMQKYDTMRIFFSKQYQIHEDQVHICPLWIGSRGTIIKADVDLLQKNIGLLPKDLLHNIATEVVSWSATIYNTLVLHK
jgi:hypothetical protein